MGDKDRIFEGRVTNPGDFVFDEGVVRVFPDMIDRSVPGYGLIIPMIGLLARRYAQAGSNIYDLGCSLGTAALTISRAVEAESVNIIAVDNSPQMINRLKQLLAEQEGAVPIQVVRQDIRETALQDASVVVLNFTLQFIDPPDRLPLLSDVATALRPGGVLILSEKLRFEDPTEQRKQADWHHDFKRARGYSELEIARKREALENVLQPETEAQHVQRLRQAGFSDVYRWYQGFSFASFIAFR